MNQQKALTILCNIINKKSSPDFLVKSLGEFSELDWAQLLFIAQQQNIELILYDSLYQKELKNITPQSIFEKLHERYLKATARNIIMLHHTGIILQALYAQNIEVITLKGIYLIEHIYSKIGLRTFGDIDLLVHKKDVAHALDVLQALGYKLQTYFNPNDTNINIKHIPPMVKENSPVVEIHWRILEADAPFTINMDEIWQRSLPANVVGVEIQRLSIEDMILHLCIHLTYQHKLRTGLSALYDISEVIEKSDDKIDWVKLILIAKKWGAERVINLSLNLLNRIIGINVPQNRLKQILSDEIEPMILDIAQRQLFSREHFTIPFTPDLIKFIKLNGIADKINIIKNRIFLPRQTMAHLYNTPLNSYKIYKYYAIRFRQLFKRYSSTIWEIMKSDERVAAAFIIEQENEDLRRWMVTQDLKL